MLEHDSQRVFIAGLAWDQPQRGHARAAQGAPHGNAFAMKFDLGSRVAGKEHRQAGRVEP